MQKSDIHTLDDAKLAALDASLGPAQLNVLLELLAKEARDAPPRLRHFVEMGNLAALAAAGHAVTGAAFGLGAQRLGAAARAVEQIGSIDQGAALAQAFAEAAFETLLALDERRTRTQDR